jgi:ribosomal protein S18 acetylase RimI-like enzyme
MPDSYEIRPVTAEDHAGWLTLWQRYLVFYESSLPAATTALLWQRLLDPEHPFRCLVAADRNTQRLLGIVQFLPHLDTWEAQPVCYLQDLYVSEDVRGKGVGAALVEAVADESERCDWTFVYWQTMHDNTRARRLYDKLTGGSSGFVVYRLGRRTAGSATRSLTSPSDPARY